MRRFGPQQSPQKGLCRVYVGVWGLFTNRGPYNCDRSLFSFFRIQGLRFRVSGFRVLVMEQMENGTEAGPNIRFGVKPAM